MMTIDEVKKKAIPILSRHGIKKAGIFGSIVRGEATEDSDIDMLVKIDTDLSLLDFAGIKIELEEALNKKVDLGEYDAIKPIIKDSILKEEVVIL